MAQHFRVDHRLVHGQIIHFWCPSLNITHIVVVADGILNAPIKQSLMKMITPSHLMLSFETVKSAASLYGCPHMKEQATLFIMENIQAADQFFKCCEALSAIDYQTIQLTIGATGKALNSHQMSQGVYMNDEDETIYHHLIKKGLKITMQALPEDEQCF